MMGHYIMLSTFLGTCTRRLRSATSNIYSLLLPRAYSAYLATALLPPMRSAGRRRRYNAYRASMVLVIATVLTSPHLAAWEREHNVVQLSPQVRILPHDKTPGAIPMDAVRAFLREHRVVNDADELQELTYVIAGDDHRLISGAGDKLYVRGNLPSDGQVGIYRHAEEYQALDGTPLGLELLKVGVAQYLRSEGDIAQLEVVSSHQEVRVNDIILPLDEAELGGEFMPREPLRALEGHIIAVPGGVRFIGRLQIVALDLGSQDGLQAGHLLRVNQQGALINDPRTQEQVPLPSTEAGSVMVFKPYEHVSYALVMQASRVLEVGDHVYSPAGD